MKSQRRAEEEGQRRDGGLEWVEEEEKEEEKGEGEKEVRGDDDLLYCIAIELIHYCARKRQRGHPRVHRLHHVCVVIDTVTTT